MNLFCIKMNYVFYFAIIRFLNNNCYFERKIFCVKIFWRNCNVPYYGRVDIIHIFANTAAIRYLFSNEI